MKIIIASDSFKGSCSTLEVADAIEKGIRKIHKDAEIIKIPVADGGEGTVEALVLGTGGKYQVEEVTDPLGNKVKAGYGILEENVAVIEMATASGLTLIKDTERNPMITTTYGTGELIRAAIDGGCRKILVGIGGSATNDGGVGMAQALGVSYKNKEGEELPFGGGCLSQLYEVDMTKIDPRLKETEFIVMSDVTNPLWGPKGASVVYGPQKGGTHQMVEELDRSLKHYANIIQRVLGGDWQHTAGAGAAGGLGFGLMAFCNAQMHSGIEKILEVTNFHQHLKGADLVITGEGQIDGQSIYGKVPVGVAKKALEYNIPVVAIVGSVGEGAEAVYSHGITAIVDIINRPMELSYAMENAPLLIEKAAENTMRLLNLNK